MTHTPESLIALVAAKLDIEVSEVYCYVRCLQQRADLVNAEPEKLNKLLDYMAHEHKKLDREAPQMQAELEDRLINNMQQ